MNTVNYSYISDVSADTRQLALKCNTSSHYCNHIILPSRAFSPSNVEYFPVVSAKKGKWHTLPVIRIRVLTCAGGITVTIPCRDELIYKKYRALLSNLRERAVCVTFPAITINNSAGGHGLYFTAHDFKMRDPDAPPEPTVYI